MVIQFAKEKNMGQNFYRVIQIERTFSFSVGGAQEVYNWLCENGCLDLINSYGSGFADVAVDKLEEMLEDVAIANIDIEKNIREDIAWAKRKKLEYLTYEVF